jgi:hypothetical protein
VGVAGGGSGEAEVVQDIASAVAGCEVLVGQEYYAAKQALLTAEQALLRALRFEVRRGRPAAGVRPRRLQPPPRTQRSSGNARDLAMHQARIVRVDPAHGCGLRRRRGFPPLWQVLVEQPWALALNVAAALRLPPGVTRLALALLDDL